MIVIVLGIRFILEVITVLGIFSGTFLSKNILYKILYFILSIAITLLWARYGAPKSASVLIGLQKFILEIFVYTIGTLSFFNLFGKTVGSIYLVIVVADLFFLYLLGLQGN